MVAKTWHDADPDSKSHDSKSHDSNPDLIEREAPFAPGSPEEQYLRNRSSYMAPDASAKVYLAFRLLLGLVTRAADADAADLLDRLTHGWDRLGPLAAQEVVAGGLQPRTPWLAAPRCRPEGRGVCLVEQPAVAGVISTCLPAGPHCIGTLR
jgi:hypothetical protein